MPSLNSDEPEDEALCPIDCDQNGCLIDDDVAEICEQIPDGVSVTFFMDCCHSGTITRIFLGAQPRPADGGRARYLPPYPALIAAHQRARATRSRGMRGAYTGKREVLFSACQSDQVAYEHGGQGDFTRHSLGVLGVGTGGMTNRFFLQRVRGAFGPDRMQDPQLWSDASLMDEPLLGVRGGGSAPPVAWKGPLSGLIAQLEALIQQLKARGVE
jgi:hypothetical protein